MLLNLEQIRIDGGTQPRAVLQQDVILEYRERMEQGANFPPPTVFFDGQEYWLADGFHRFAAILRAFPAQPLECDVRQGTLQDAQWFSYSANQSHGLRRTNEDKQRAVRAALAHCQAANLSNCQIAKHCGVDEGTVRKYREPMQTTSEVPKSTPRTGRDGRTINTTNIGKRRPPDERTPRKQRGGISPNAHRPVRDYESIYPAKTALELPHDAEMGARTLISVFDAAYLRKLVDVLMQHLSQEGTEE
jgi:transposase-like protein